MSTLVELIKQLPDGLLIATVLVVVVAMLMAFWWPRVSRYAQDERMPLYRLPRLLYQLLVCAILVACILLLALGIWHGIAGLFAHTEISQPILGG